MFTRSVAFSCLMCKHRRKRERPLNLVMCAYIYNIYTHTYPHTRFCSIHTRQIYQTIKCSHRQRWSAAQFRVVSTMMVVHAFRCADRVWHLRLSIHSRCLFRFSASGRVGKMTHRPGFTTTFLRSRATFYIKYRNDCAEENDSASDRVDGLLHFVRTICPLDKPSGCFSF